MDGCGLLRLPGKVAYIRLDSRERPAQQGDKIMGRKKVMIKTVAMNFGDKTVDVPVSSAVGKDNVKPETALAKPDELKAESMTILGQAKAIQITNHEQAMAAGDFLKAVKELKKRIEEKLAPLVKAAYDSWKKQVAYRKEHDDPLDQAEAAVKAKMNAYLAEQERQRRLEEQRQQLEAQKAAEAQAEQDALLMEATGDAEAAEMVRTEPVVAPVVVLAPVEKPKGIATQSVWRWKVINESLVPNEYKIIDQTKIGGVVRAMKAATNIPGVQVYEDKIVKTY